jgi:hypothetical protein
MDKGRPEAQCVKGVGCDVTNCRYNDTTCRSCVAERINVQNRNAIKKGETFCDTFTPRTSY